jgi:hypothetical protein
MAFRVLYQSGGLVDVPVDPDPNVTPPPSDRVLTVGNDVECTSRRHMQFTGIQMFVGDGTSLSVCLWCYDDATGRWWRQFAPFTLTAATGGIALTPWTFGVKCFIQVTANTGNVKRLMFASK